MNEIPVNIIPLNTQIRNGKKWFFFKTPTYDKPIDMEYDLAVQAGFCPKDMNIMPELLSKKELLRLYPPPYSWVKMANRVALYGHSPEKRDSFILAMGKGEDQFEVIEYKKEPWAAQPN